MRFSCQVQVVNYKMPISGPNMQPRSRRSTITLGGYGGSTVGGKLWILHQNSENGAGIRYKVNSNVVTLYIKFLREGKMTIRLKEPPVDLRISGEPAEVTKFGKMIGEFTSGRPLPAVGPHKIANLETISRKMEPPPKRYLEILDKKELPLFKTGYPISLNELVISNVGMLVVDPKIFRLPHLKILRLECNNLSMIPKSIELLTGLTQLYLKGNCLGSSRREKDWEWLRCKSLQASLKVLDLSSNELKRLPNHLIHLQALTTLKLDSNKLISLPNNLGFAKKLRTLSVKNNCLNYMPGSLLDSKIEAMDISENRFIPTPAIQEMIVDPNQWPVASLRSIAACAVLCNRLEFDETVLPRELIRLLESACYCRCGKATFPSYPNLLCVITARALCSCVTYDQTVGVLLGFRLCRHMTPRCQVRLK